MAHIFIESLRWQMVFIYLLLCLYGLLYFKKSVSHIFLRIVGFVLALILLGISVFYAIYMPVFELDPPIGRYSVGTVELYLTDPEREELFTEDPDDRRKLLVELWYPAKFTTNVNPKPLWSGLYTGEPDIISFLTGYLQDVPTHSYPNAIPAEGRYPLLLFNHGLQMFSSQNTLLMEHLASHGYIVASIGHPYESIRVDFNEGQAILPEFVTGFQEFQEGMAWIEAASAPILTAREKLQVTNDSLLKSEIMLQAVSQATTINSTVTLWSEDSQFVLDTLLGTSGKQQVELPQIDTTRIGAMGMSLGGAVAGELCKLDPRFRAGVNIDGLQYGTRVRDSLKVPFMILNSDEGTGMNDFVAQRASADYFEYHLSGTRHSDLSDMAVVWPILKVYGQGGKHSGKIVSQIMNSLILDFWDLYFKNKPGPNLKRTPYKGLKIKMIKQSSL